MYRNGECNLREYSHLMAEENIYWFERIENFNFIIIRVFKIVDFLLKNKIYQSDYKSDNFVLLFSGKIINYTFLIII